MKTLIGVDFSPTSTAAGDWVSRWFLPDAALGVAYSVRVPEGPSFTRLYDEGHAAILARAKEEAAKTLAPLVQEFGPDRAEALVGSGPPAEALLELAGEWDAELIAVGPHGHGALLTGFFGSTASHLLRHSPLPVLVVRSPEARPPKRILAAVDDRDLTAKVLAYAKRVHDIHGCEVQGFYTFETLLEGLPIFTGPSGDVDLEEGLRETAEAWLKEVLVDAGIPRGSVRTKAATGRAGAAICEAAEDDVDLIVMGTHGAPLAGPSLGSVARYVVGHAPCPVLVVPRGRAP